MNNVYIACISLSKYLKSFFPFVSDCLQTLLLPVCVYAGLGQYAPVPTALSCGSCRHGAGTARPLSELQDWEPAEKCLAVTAQHSAVQHSYPPNAFHTQQIELLWSSHFIFFQQTKLFTPLFLNKEFCHMLQINCNLSDALLPPTSWAAFKKEKKQLEHFCFCFNQTKIETFCSLIQGLMCLITPFFLRIN